MAPRALPLAIRSKIDPPQTASLTKAPPNKVLWLESGSYQFFLRAIMKAFGSNVRG